MGLKELVKSGKESRPLKICIYGTHGIGKTTFAAGAPKPILLQTEDGAGNVDCDKLPMCLSFQDTLSQLKLIIEDEHDYETLIVDSLDWLETLIHTHVCKTRGKMSMADFDFGRGYGLAADEFGRIIKAFDLVRDRGMHVLMIAHCKSEEFKCPLNGIYNRYSLDLHKHIAAKIDHYVDILGFAHFSTRVISDDGKFNSEQRRVVGGRRVIGFSDSPAYDAKRRINMPEEIELNADKFWEIANEL